MKVIDVVAVKFVGKTPHRRDNLRGTGTLWTRPGDIQMVNREDAEVLARHPDVWKIVPLENDTQYPQLTDVQAQARKMDERDEDKPGRQERIRQVIGELDRDNTELWTSSGKPKTEAIREHIPDVSASEVSRAWSAMGDQ